MTDNELDTASWSKEKLLQKDGDSDFLEEKLNKWHTFAYHWKMKRPRKIFLTADIDRKIDQGDTLREWLDVIYTPLEATILAASIILNSLLDVVTTPVDRRFFDIISWTQNIADPCEIQWTFYPKSFIKNICCRLWLACIDLRSVNQAFLISE